MIDTILCFDILTSPWPTWNELTSGTVHIFSHKRGRIELYLYHYSLLHPPVNIISQTSTWKRYFVHSISFHKASKIKRSQNNSTLQFISPCRLQSSLCFWLLPLLVPKMSPSKFWNRVKSTTQTLANTVSGGYQWVYFLTWSCSSGFKLCDVNEELIVMSCVLTCKQFRDWERHQSIRKWRAKSHRRWSRNRLQRIFLFPRWWWKNRQRQLGSRWERIPSQGRSSANSSTRPRSRRQAPRWLGCRRTLIDILHLIFNTRCDRLH